MRHRQQNGHIVEGLTQPPRSKIKLKLPRRQRQGAKLWCVEVWIWLLLDWNSIFLSFHVWHDCSSSAASKNTNTILWVKPQTFSAIGTAWRFFARTLFGLSLTGGALHGVTADILACALFIAWFIQFIICIRLYPFWKLFVQSLLLFLQAQFNGWVHLQSADLSTDSTVWDWNLVKIPGSSLVSLSWFILIYLIWAASHPYLLNPSESQEPSLRPYNVELSLSSNSVIQSARVLIM